MSLYVSINSIHEKDLKEVEKTPYKIDIIHNGEIYIDDYDDLEEEEFERIKKWKPQEKEPIRYEIGNSNEWITYLLTGKTEWNSGSSPLNFLNANHRCVNDYYNLYDSQETYTLYKKLLDLNIKEIIENYNPDNFNKLDISPRGYIWKEDDRDSIKIRLEEIISFFKELTKKKLGFYVSWE